MRENYCKQCNQQGLNLQNIQSTHTTQQQNKTKQNKTEEWAKELGRHFSKEDTWMANRHIKKKKKKSLISLIFREMQIKIKMRYHLTLVRMTVINKSTNNKCW